MFTVRASRGGDTVTRSRAWVVDRTAPTAPEIVGGARDWQANAATLRAVGSSDALAGVRTYEWQASEDGGTTWTRDQSGATMTLGADGTWLVRARAVDGAGNRSQWRSREIRIDSTAPPVPNVTGASPSWRSVQAVTLTAAATDAQSGVASIAWETSRDGGNTWQPVADTSAASIDIAFEGTTVVRASAINNAGMRSGRSATTVRVDRTAPSAALLGGGTGDAWAGTNVTLTASAHDDESGVSHVEYSVSSDGGTAWSAWGAPVPNAHLLLPPGIVISASGMTLVRARVVDAAGNVGASSEIATVRIDRTEPSWTDLDAFRSGWTDAANLTMEIAASDDVAIASYWYRTRTTGAWGAPRPATGGKVTISDEAASEVQVEAIDVAGRTTGWTWVGVALIDRTGPPAPRIGGGTGVGWSTGDVEIAIVALGESEFEGAPYGSTQASTSTNGGATWSEWERTASEGSYTVTGTGTTLVRLRLVDAAGNIGAASTEEQVHIDPTAPGVPVPTGGANEWANVAVRTVTATPGDGAAVTAYEYRTFAGGSQTPSTEGVGGSLDITAEGETRVEFRARDASGRWGLWGGSWPGGYVRLDRQAPTVEFVPVPAPVSGTHRFVASFISNDGRSSLDDWTLTLDGPVTTTVCSNTSAGHNRSPGVYCDFDTRTVPNGTYDLELVGGDLAGNSATGSISVDVDNP